MDEKLKLFMNGSDSHLYLRDPVIPVQGLFFPWIV